MKALSIKQPWAALITMGLPVFEPVDNRDGSTSVKFKGRVVVKTIENRTWPLPKGFALPQRIYIHTGKRLDNDALEWLLHQRLPAWSVLMLHSPLLGRGAIIGEVDIVDCISESDNPWFSGPYGFVLKNPVAYAKPIPYKGKLGFFEVNLT